MGFHIDNFRPGPHVSGGVLLGYSPCLHRGDQGLYTAPTDCSWPAFRAVLVAARTGTDATLDGAAIAAWGSWWGDVVLSRGQRDAARMGFQNYLPPGVPIP